jgi:phospholipase C
VSWIIPPLGFDEHPSSSPNNGMYFTSLVLDALTANPAVWAKTALFLMYDENDGWFDHVPPPTAPVGTPGEYLTAAPSSTLEPDSSSEDLGIKGPLGLGVRVPCLAISPFSRGGHIASQTFDHTSQLQLVAERFGVEVPNVSAWRKKTVGDLTTALFAGSYSTAIPALPPMGLPAQQLSGACAASSQDTESGGADPSVPTHQTMPNQQGGTSAASAYITTADVIGGLSDRTVLGPAHPRPVTKKSSYNRLAV